jgi:pimeloyl-ACP methyl ester carboxylesterase
MMTTLDGFPVLVGVAGPEKGVVVVILGDEQRAPAAYDAVCERLHTASLRTVVIGLDPRLTAKSVVGILDALGIGWAVVVGDRAGGELAWELAATRLGRFVGLVVVDRGHPRVADLNGVIRDDQPAVRVRRIPHGGSAWTAQCAGVDRAVGSRDRVARQHLVAPG